MNWCTAQGRGDDHCFAKLLSHTAGPVGSTVYGNGRRVDEGMFGPYPGQFESS